MSPERWAAHYEPGVPQDVSDPAPDATFHALLEAAAADAPGYRAIEACNRAHRYADVDALAVSVATALQRGGLEAGQSVILAVPSGVHFAAAAQGVLKAGGVVVPLPPDAEAGILAAAARTVRPSAALAWPPAADALVEPMLDCGGELVVVHPEEALPAFLRLLYRLRSPWRRTKAGRLASENAVAWQRWLGSAADFEARAVTADDPALTVVDPATGAPQCTFTHRHLLAGAEQLRCWLTDALPGEDTWLLLDGLDRPFGFVAGLGAAVKLRARLVLVPGQRSHDALDALRYLRPAYVAASAEAMDRLVSDPRLPHSDTRSVRAWLVSDPITHDLARAFEEYTGVSLCEGYAPPCTAGLAACNPVNGRRTSGSIGLPMPGIELRLGEEAGADGAEGGGELALRGPNIAASGGWLVTGAVARFDEDGFLYLVRPGEGAPGAAERGAVEPLGTA